ncbi:MAG: gliding motility protein GldM [Chitinophagaceae bacterium]|nr:MAG: gliding motility protein GldM [Chitinophagaceae bacterium]
MAGGANPLRQQMINMMYLVLTALLALNVSADILKAFALVNGGLEKTNNDYSAKNTATMTQFAKAFNDDKTKTQKLYDNAQIANTEADKVYNELQQIKEELAKEAKGWSNDEHTAVDDAQNLEIAEQHFVTFQNGKNGKELRQKLIDFQAKMKSLLIDEKGNPSPGNVKFDIDTQAEYIDKKDKTKKEWHEYYFGGVPVIAAITEITKFQNDVKNAQSEVTNHLFKQIGAVDVKFDNQIAIISSKTPAVFQGGKYEAEVLLGAFSSTQPFTAIVNGQTVPVVNGIAKYTTSGSGIGDKDVKVKIQYKDGKGEMQTRETSTKYQVFTGSATIAADKMNMLYIGLENPMSISVPGFSDAQTTVNFTTGANAKKTGPGKYILKPTEAPNREIKVTVSAKMPDGSTKQMGSQVYRVRKVPNPEVLFGTKPGGAISRGELVTVSQINAGLGEGFAYEGLKYNVLSYTFAISPKAGGNAYFEQVSGNKVSGTMRGKLQNARPGDLIVIANVEVMGPVGKKMLNGTNLTVR